MNRTIHVRDARELAAAVHAAGVGPLHVSGSGRPPDGFDGVVVAVGSRGVWADASACDVDDLAPCGGVTVTVAAGEPFDALVGRCVDEGWAGLELLSGRPGTVAGAVVGGACAYGRSVGDVLASVRTVDREGQAVRTFAAVDCRVQQGVSRFRDERMPDGSPRYVVLDVTLLVRAGDLTAPIEDPVLASRLGIAVGERVSTVTARDAILGGAS